MRSRPLVGITTYRERARWGTWDAPAVLLPASYAEAVAAAGGEPVLLPTGSSSAAVVARLDALVLAGGADVDPARYGARPGPRTTVLRPSAHMTEETRDAAVSGPRGIVTAIWVSVVAGFVLMVGLSVAVPYAVGTDEYAEVAAGGILAGPAIIVDAVGGTAGELLLLAVIVAQFFCGMASVTANSRMIYAFARDGAIPGSRLWHRINPRTRTPTNGIWFAVVGAIVLGLPSLYTNEGYAVAFFAIVSVAVVGLYVSYVIPVFLRRMNPAFVPGPWQLGRGSAVIGWAAVAWVVFILFPLMGPQSNPFPDGEFTVNAVNFAPLVLLAVIGFAGVYWLVSARHWFTGPKVQGSAQELAEIERDLNLPV